MDPADYPFPQPSSSQLVLGEGTVPIADALLEGKSIEEESIANWRVRNGEELLTVESFAGAQYAPLVHLPRCPVVAYGSNANPDVLREKLTGEWPAFVPMLRGQLRDFDVVYSAHVSPKGTIPATLSESPETCVTVFVLLLDVNQLVAMDRTEPNYDRMLLTKPARLTLDLGPCGDAYVYVSKHGLLNVDGAPRRIAPIPASKRRFSPLTEPQVLAIARDRLGAVPGGEREVAEAQTETLKRDALTGWTPAIAPASPSSRSTGLSLPSWSRG